MTSYLAIGWTDISQALTQRKVEECTLQLGDQEQVIQLACSQ